MTSRCKHTCVRILEASLLAGLLWLVGAPVVHAQDVEVEGVVLSAEDGTPLPGVNVVEAGTQTGTATDGEGAFSLAVSGPDASLTFSFIGFASQTVPLDGRSELVVELEPETAELEGVVVTALGIERQQRSLGYATSQVDTEEIVQVPQAGVADLLQGQVPGLVVSPNAGGIDASSTVIIRGFSSIGGDNQPLYVVDGIPIDNTTIGSAGRFGGFVGGSALSIVNPNNIASLSVLKGAGAAALYGSRARDGVILINTKTGRGVTGGGYEVNFSSTLTAQSALTGFADFQNEYGQGGRGLAPATQAEAFNAGLGSWGAPLDAAAESVQFDGATRPYAALAERRDFYQTALSRETSLSFNAGYESTSLRLSASHMSSESIVPNSDYQQLTVTLRGQSQFGNLTADANVTYLSKLANNRTRLGDPSRNPNFITAFLPANVPLSALQPGYAADSTELQFSANDFLTNPYWATERFEADDDRDRILGGVNLNYAVLDWLAVQARTGLDWYTLRRTSVTPFGTAFLPGGDMVENEYRVWENNTKVLVSATPGLTENLSVRVDAGGNARRTGSEQVGIFGTGFNIPFFKTISNLANQTPLYNYSEKHVNSLFGSVAFNYDDYAFLTVTGRNDWSSTLPEENNSYFYPSVSGSFVFTDAFEVGGDWLTFGKLRASWAKIGGDTSPYRLRLTYDLIGSHQGRPLGTIAQTEVPLFNLRPTSTTEVELGFESSFFNDRVGVDFTWYQRSTIDQIIPVSISGTSGYSSRVANSGEVENSGVELLLTTTPLVTPDVNWRVNLNLASNTSEVVSLVEGQEIRFDALNRIGTANIVQKIGAPANAIYGNTYVRDEAGRLVHGPDGLPVIGDPVVLGKGAPDWAVGLSNRVAYKNVSLNVLLDAKFGGQLYSGTNAYAYLYGLHENTLEGRQVCDEQLGEDGYPEAGCMVGDGVKQVVDEEGEVLGYEQNDIEVLPSEYYGRIGGSIAEEFVYDADYVSLRQVRLAYQLPQSWLGETPFQGATVSLVGRNLFYLFDNVPNVNPEMSYNNAASPGFELASVPNTRSFGFRLDVTL